ncbi:formate dehydrogenase accessory sulfurtransferase FdhD [Terrihabitans rhizophilus]|uniref:Sulfur carrier protein FdhD n=1 Tax=Terrihabitans rhizophilus TaxID=3092662 RepID=A0ABU4RQ83_9HYPH|nr:formate dehydrogenase accessory sulfurtransferase FdhD [Terrihabitans sp. PJ23]MDX6805785.1 formate dehydrogenase accessory sulfurtransferase FdhD [Terrihabitans sp. PJ23]
MPDASLGVARLSWRGGAFEAGQRIIPTEVPIAITYGGSTQAVMMATPSDLEDFAVGFTVTEGLIQSTSDIRSLEVIEEDEGVELRMWLAPELADAYSRRRRLLAGPTGCGLCGIESLTEAVRTPPSLSVQVQYQPAEIIAAMASLGPAQALNQQTRATHAAGFWTRSGGLLAVREDVGRHNALDKLAGHVLRTGADASDGIIVLTSRVSVEMVQKAAMMGTPVIAAVSAPTALAVRTAEAAGITLIAVARGEEFELFTHPDRVAGAALTV